MVFVSSVVRMSLGHRIVTPWIMVDELIYSELAKSLAAHGQFLIRGVPSNGYGFVYPALIAPAFGLFHSVPQAYAAAKDINAVVMSLAAVPVYFLARRLVTARLALVAAALSLLIPSLLYTGMLMTENAFYPIFLLAALVLVLTLERPTPRATGPAPRALRPGLRDPGTGDRLRPRGARRAGSARLDRARPPRAAPPVRDALRHRGRSRRARARRDGRPRPLAARAARRVSRGCAQRLHAEWRRCTTRCGTSPSSSSTSGSCRSRRCSPSGSLRGARARQPAPTPPRRCRSPSSSSSRSQRSRRCNHFGSRSATTSTSCRCC